MKTQHIVGKIFMVIAIITATIIAGNTGNIWILTVVALLVGYLWEKDNIPHKEEKEEKQLLILPDFFYDMQNEEFWKYIESEDSYYKLFDNDLGGERLYFDDLKHRTDFMAIFSPSHFIIFWEKIAKEKGYYTDKHMLEMLELFNKSIGDMNGKAGMYMSIPQIKSWYDNNKPVDKLIESPNSLK